jgi:glutamine---fructose-6-phosphate transaminase (isomerizing)
MGLRDEILEQPAVLKRLVETQWRPIERVAQAIAARQVSYVMIAARGTSDHAAVYAQYIWGSYNRLPVALAAPSLISQYGASPDLGHALVVGISQSGQSPDILGVVAEGRRQGALTLAITNEPASPIAQAAELVLPIGAGPERAVAATKTYSATLGILAALSVAMAGDARRKADLDHLPEAVSEALQLEPMARQLAEQHRAMTHCVVLGRGYNYSTAHEWALKLKELAYVLADPYSAADFQHGPIAIVEGDFPILAVAPRGVVYDDMLLLLRQLRDEWHADLIVISDESEAVGLCDAGFLIPSGIPEWLTPLVCIGPAQLFCYYLTRAKGYDPETPRGLHKVTLTQ